MAHPKTLAVTRRGRSTPPSGSQSGWKRPSRRGVVALGSRHRHTERVLTTPVAEEHPPGLEEAETATTRLDTGLLYVVERGAWSLVWIAVMAAGIGLWGFWWWSPFVVALAPLMVLAGIGGVAWCWMTHAVRSPLFQGTALASVVVTLLFPQAIEINTRTFYTTDAAAFDHVAAQALVHGLDPYKVSMSTAAGLFSAPARYWTYTVGGGHVAHFSYPAGSVLLDAVAMALGFHHMIVDWVDLGCWLATIILVFVLLPASLRWLSGLLALTPALLGSFSAGGTDAMFLPFLVLAVWRWDSYGDDRDAGVARWIGPVALGLACAIKQTPWFCVPFLATGIFVEARRCGRPALRLVLRYLSTVVAVFAVVNAPFVIWGPGGWLRGTLIPLTGGLVADGQGLVSLATHGLTGGVDLKWLSVAGALTLVATVTAFVIGYSYLKRAWVILVTLPFFFAPRSLATYFLDLLPVALIAAVSVRRVPAPVTTAAVAARPLRWRRSGMAVVVASCLGVVVSSTLAFVGEPLQLSVGAVTTSHRGRQVDAITVSVVNRTASTVVPHFLVNTGSNPQGFWTPPGHGAVVLGPHASTIVILYPPAPATSPQKGARWLVEAYTGSWLSTSSSSRFFPAP
jgi:uncharacterized membrane protein